MNYSCDIDLFRGWAEATCFGRLSQETTKKYNASMIFKRAQGDGIVREHRGLQDLLRRYGPHVATIEVPLPSKDERQAFIEAVERDDVLPGLHVRYGTTLALALATFGVDCRAAHEAFRAEFLQERRGHHELAGRFNLCSTGCCSCSALCN